MPGTRQIVLDTETTGMNQGIGPHYQGHRIIEIGCVEVINRRLTGNHFHVYLQPDMAVDPEAIQVHGITDDFLMGKPHFEDVAEDFINYIDGAELVIHNAPFDVGFMDMEFQRWNKQAKKTEQMCRIVDSLVMARRQYPGQKNNLDALCKRLGIDNSHRTLHGALLDAEILADVYLMMTGGQTDLNLSAGQQFAQNPQGVARIDREHLSLNVIRASDEELAAHQAFLEKIDKKCGSTNMWSTLASEV